MSKKYDSLDLISGNIIENIIYNKLSFDYELDNIFFYRTISKSEIDFIVQKDDQILPIEVKFRNKIMNMPVSINNFSKLYDDVKYKLLITKDDLKID